MKILKNGLLLMCLLSLSTIGLAQTSKDYKKDIKKHRKEYKKGFLNNEHSPLNKQQVK